MKQILYNVTFKISEDFLDEWLEWARSAYVGMHMDGDTFSTFKILRILGDDTEHGSSYAVQFIAESLVSFQRFAGSTALTIQTEQRIFCGEKALGFSTIMEIIAC